ncbi:hypothetical protein L0Z72_13835, partial [candidate division KSB1 bacterium]|nr:hypothetical protein [candidate division KSB1 bacterium]
LFDGEEKIAEIDDLKFCNVRLQPHGRIIIGASVPMPLFWWQYANHQHPERNAGSNGKLSIIKQDKNEIIFCCDSQNQSGSALSHYEVGVKFSPEIQSYAFSITAKLIIPEGKEWQVTHNPSHGEVEFCNFWPQDVFSIDPNIKKLYQACYVKKKDAVYKIPHHHLETSDKNNIHLEAGDQFFWGIETTNLVIEILSEQNVCAGVCAYMWDTHFGFRICDQSNDVILAGKQEFQAKFKLYSINKKTAAAMIEDAQEPDLTEILQIPIYIDGLNTFSKSLLDLPEKFDKLWQWNFETNGKATGSLDHQSGYSDHHSLKIENHQPTESAWLATSIGPAYGEAPIPDRVRLKLSALVRTENLNGRADIAIRYFSFGMGNIFNISDYRIIQSEFFLSKTQNWQKIEVITALLSPAPERVHLLLRMSGTGKAWFDDVILEKFSAH